MRLLAPSLSRPFLFNFPPEVPACSNGSKVQLSEPFVGKTQDGVLLFLKCCYQPAKMKSFMEASLREEPSEVPLHELLALTHRFQVGVLVCKTKQKEF